VGHGRRDRAEADPLGHAELANELHGRIGELVPAKVRLGAGEDEEVLLTQP
jgi:hypothetical protein